jgi:hypothetical protein
MIIWSIGASVAPWSSLKVTAPVPVTDAQFGGCQVKGSPVLESVLASVVPPVVGSVVAVVSVAELVDVAASVVESVAEVVVGSTPVVPEEVGPVVPGSAVVGPAVVSTFPVEPSVLAVSSPQAARPSAAPATRVQWRSVDARFV